MARTHGFIFPEIARCGGLRSKKLDDLRSPLGFLLGKTRLEKELDGLSVAPDVAPLTPGNTVLRGVPKGMADRVNQVVLEITPDYRIARIQFEEADESVTEYRFSEQRENAEIADQRFRFTPPPGVEIVEGDFGRRIANVLIYEHLAAIIESSSCG